MSFEYYDPNFDPGYDEHAQIRAEMEQLEQKILADQAQRADEAQQQAAADLISNVDAQLDQLGVKSERDREMIVSRAISVAQTTGSQNLDLSAAHLELHEAKMDTLPPPPETPLPDGANNSQRSQWMMERLQQVTAHNEDMSHAQQYASPEGPPVDASAQDRVAWMTEQVNGEAA